VSKLIDEMAVALAVSPDVLEKGLKYAHTRFRRIHVKKRSGGTRVMIQPAPELRLIQQWLMTEILGKLPVSQIASAFERGCSIVKNAKSHAEAKYSVRVDIKSFFPSIKSKDLFLMLGAAGPEVKARAKSIPLRNMIRIACFDDTDSLPIGYMTSPHIANFVMRDLDVKLLEEVSADKVRFGRAKVTRYADDFVFSTDKRGACREFVKCLGGVLRKCKNPSLSINTEKTRFMSRAGGSTIVTGMRVKPSGEVGIHANYRDHVRLLLKLHSEDRLKPEDWVSLRGHLAFVQHADPSLFTRLAYRYHDEMAKLLQ
jgi:hypothetical protein